MYKGINESEDVFMVRRTKEEAAATRDSVLLAALDLFSDKGYSRTTFSDIANQIGKTRGAVYWHFENKQALLSELIEYLYEHEAEWVGVSTREVNTLEELRAIFVDYARTILDDPVSRKFAFFMNYQMEWSEKLLAETHVRLNELRATSVQDFQYHFSLPTIAERLRADVDVDVLTSTLLAFWLGARKMFLEEFANTESAEEFDLKQRIGDGFDLIMRGALK